jgi:hypothetical protein
MTTATEPEQTTAVERAELALRDAVAAGSERRIDRAARALQRARESAARAADRARDRQAAQLRVDEARRARERAAKERRADEVERELRAREPAVSFHLPDGRTVTVRLAGRDQVERTTAIEAVRRLAWAVCNGFQGRVVASRNLGAAAAEADWIGPLLGTSDGLLPATRRNLITVAARAAST